MKKYNNLEKFIEILVDYEKNEPFPIFSPPIDAQFTLDCLTEAFLGPNYYITVPVCTAQANSIILDEILRIYSRDYRNLIKRKKKELKRNGKKTKSNY